MTWATLLAHWASLAQASMALPAGAEGDRWRAAVPAIIDLQAVTCALDDLDRLAEPDERALALDKADMLIQRDADALSTLWNGEDLHPELQSLIVDACEAHAAAEEGGVEWVVTAERLVAEHPAELVEVLLAMGFAGDLYVPTPGVPIFRTCPATFARDMYGASPDKNMSKAIRTFLGGSSSVSKPQRVPYMRMAYRQFDFSKGSAVRDAVEPYDDEPASGQALLIPAILEGEPQPVGLPPRNMPKLDALPVVFVEESR
ncbi:MAG: hypothetical protein H7210_10930 [Pyrinomonadaceae bacterium]|nr:hypothetical protein [Phycisphaerales bacterium]